MLFLSRFTRHLLVSASWETGSSLFLLHPFPWWPFSSTMLAGHHVVDIGLVHQPHFASLAGRPRSTIACCPS